MKAPAYAPVQAFGWNLFRATAEKGAVFHVRCAQDMTEQTRDHATVWTRGNMLSNTGYSRLPGDNSREARALSAGDHVFVAQEDSEWWCATAERNGGRLPRMVGIAVPPGGSCPLKPGSLLLVCSPGLGYDVGTPLAITSVGRQLSNAGTSTAWLISFSERRPVL